MMRFIRSSKSGKIMGMLVALTALSCGTFAGQAAPTKAIADSFGEPIWHYQGQSVLATRASNERVYVLDGASVIALDAATGAPVWRSDDVGVIEKDTWRFAGGYGRVAVLAAHAPGASSKDVGRLTVLSAETGKRMWQNDAVKLARGIVPAKRTVFAFDAQHRLVAFDADTGAERGKTASDEFTASIDHARILARDDLVFTIGDTPAPNYHKRFFAFDGMTGKVKWYVDDRVRAFHLHPSDDALVLELHSPDELAAYDPITGTKLGVVAEIPDDTRKRIADDQVIYSKNGKQLSAIEKQTSKPLWTTTPPFQIEYFIGASDKALYAMHTEKEGCLAFNCPTQYYALVIDKTNGQVTARVLTDGWSPSFIITRARVFGLGAKGIWAYPAVPRGEK